MDRKAHLHYWIKQLLKDALRCAKAKNKICAKDYLAYLQGIMFYAQSVGDVSEETYRKVVNLKQLIAEKYYL